MCQLIVKNAIIKWIVNKTHEIILKRLNEASSIRSTVSIRTTGVLFLPLYQSWRHNSLIFYFSASKTFEKVVKFYKKMKDYVLL